MKIKYINILLLCLMTMTGMADDFEDEGRKWLRMGNEKYEQGYFDVAVGYYLKAAEFHVVEAQFYLGYALYKGEGIRKDYTSAVMWFKRAANSGYPQAEYNLAYCYMEGHGVPRDYEKAQLWLLSSANHGYLDAQKTLAECYEKGILFEQDSAKCQYWKDIAEGISKTTKPSSTKALDSTQDTTVNQTALSPNEDVFSSPPLIDIELEGELHERTQPAKDTVSQIADDTTVAIEKEVLSEKRAPIILYPPGQEPKKASPMVKILFPKDQSFFHTDVVKVKYQLIADGLESKTEVTALVDGVKRGTDTRAVHQANSIDVEVPNRDCTVTLFAHNEAGNSEPVSIRLIRENIAQGDMPRLFCVVVGVGDYNDDKLQPLKLATKDAHDFAEAVSKKRGLPFSDVQVKVLIDKEATRTDIFEAMEWLQQETTPNDVCIFYYAGHGYRDEKDRFYFMPYGGTTDKLYNCFSAADFRNMADDINCKLIVFADACFSAALFEGSRSAATTHFVEQLRRTKNGVMLYASSASDTKSKEDASWGNGAFTKALVQAFNGGARQQFDEGLSTQALEMYIYKEVRRITNFKQTPIFINPNGMEHFNIFIYEE